MLVLLLALLMILCSGLTLTACNGSTPPDDPGGIETPGDEPGTDPDDPGADPDDPGTNPDDPGTDPDDPDEPGDNEGSEGEGSFQGNRPGKPNREDSYQAK